MKNRLQKAPKITVIQGRDGVDGRAAGCRTVKELIGYTSGSGRPTASNGVDFIWFPGNPLTNDPPRWIQVPAPLSPSTGGSAAMPIYKETLECWPALTPIPAIPSKVIKSASNGWLDGARSDKDIKPEQFFEVDIRRNPIAIMVGLSDEGLKYSYNAMKHAIVIRSEGIYEVVNGVDGVLQPKSISKLKISRQGSTVYYYADDIVVAETHMDESRELYAYVLLYASTDYVFNPRIGAVAGGTSELLIETFINSAPMGISALEIQTDAVAMFDGNIYVKGLSAFAIRSDGKAHAAVRTEGTASVSIGSYASTYSGLSLDSRANSQGIVEGSMTCALGALGIRGAAAEKVIARAFGVFPSIRLNGSLARAEAQAIGAEGLFPAPTIYSWVLNGGFMSGEAVLHAKGKASELPYFGGTINYVINPVIGGWFDDMAKGVISTNELVLAKDYLDLDSSYLFSFLDGISAGFNPGVFDVYMLVGMSLNESIFTSDELSFDALLELIINEQIQISPNTSIARQEALQYAVNSITGALSRYSNFGFKQFATSSCTTYAITDTGIYELLGNRDGSDTISASIDFGASDYGTAQSKRVSSVYAGIATDGGVYIKVAGDRGEEIVYKAINYGTESRSKTAKGIVAKHWRIRLELTDASYADLDNIEVEVGVSQRRLQR